MLAEVRWKAIALFLSRGASNLDLLPGRTYVLIITLPSLSAAPYPVASNVVTLRINVMNLRYYPVSTSTLIMLFSAPVRTLDRKRGTSMPGTIVNRDLALQLSAAPCPLRRQPMHGTGAMSQVSEISAPWLSAGIGSEILARELAVL